MTFFLFYHLLLMLQCVHAAAPTRSIEPVERCLLSLPVDLQVVAWYDNEWGYSQRVVDLAEITAKNWE